MDHSLRVGVHELGAQQDVVAEAERQDGSGPGEQAEDRVELFGLKRTDARRQPVAQLLDGRERAAGVLQGEDLVL